MIGGIKMGYVLLFGVVLPILVCFTALVLWHRTRHRHTHTYGQWTDWTSTRNPPAGITLMYVGDGNYLNYYWHVRFCHCEHRQIQVAQEIPNSDFLQVVSDIEV